MHCQAAAPLLSGRSLTTVCCQTSWWQRDGLCNPCVLTGQAPCRVDEECSGAVNSLVNACLDMDAGQRPDARSVVHRLDVIISELAPTSHGAPAPPAPAGGLGKPRGSFSEPPLHEPLAPARNSFTETAQGLTYLSADSLRCS